MSSRPRRSRRGALSALVVSGIVFGAILLEQVLTGTLSLVQAASFGVAIEQLFASSALANISAAGLSTLPLALGIFFSLWLIAPIGAELRVGHVLTRSALASGVGALLALVVSSIGGVVGVVFNYGSSIFRTGVGSIAEQIPFALGYALVTSLGALLTALPIAALVALLLWIRLREHDRDYRVEGMLDL